MKFGLRHILCFVTVAEELHFRRAAEKLGVAQPALSRSIQFLEKELDVLLFHRSNRNVEITQAGATFLNGCRNILTRVARGVDDTRLADQGQIGSIRIGYTDNAIIGALPSIIKNFQAQQPGIVVRIHHDVTTTQLVKLAEEEMDFGFVTGPIVRSGFEQCLIQSERFVCVVYESHKFANRRSIGLEELANEDFVHGLSDDWEHFYSHLIPLCRKSGFVPNIIQAAYNTTSILGLVSCGMGITILTENVRNSIGPGLVIIPIEDISELLQTVAIWKIEVMDGSKELFVDYLHSITDAITPISANRNN
jgi:DNA-binding transcriptional LysR family regulator